MSDDPKPTSAATELTDRHLELFKTIPVSVICDACDRLGLPDRYLGETIRPMTAHALVGRARTVSRRALAAQAGTPGVPDWQSQRLVDLCTAGDVLVISTEAAVVSSTWGGNFSLRAAQIGIAGLVTDGAIRDLEECQAIAVPLFAAAVNARRSVGRLETIATDRPVHINGVEISGGDIIIGDRDGVIVVRRDEAESVSKECGALLQAEAGMQALISTGGTLELALTRFKSPKSKSAS